MARQRRVKKDTTPSSFVMLDNIFVRRAPQLPKGLKKWIVRYGPWIILVILIISLPVIILAASIGADALPLGIFVNPKGGAGFSIGVFFFLVEVILVVAALTGLLRKLKQGWNLMLYALFVNIAANLVKDGLQGIVSLIITVIISLYILFQVRSYYK